MRHAAVPPKPHDGWLWTMPVPHADATGQAAGRCMLHHRVVTPDDFDHLSTQAGLPHIFRPLGREAPMLDIEGACLPGLAIWNVASPTGFESVPADVPDAYTIRIPLDRCLIRRSAGQESETSVGSATIVRALETVATRFVPGARVLSCAVGVQDLVARNETLEGTEASFVGFQPTVPLAGQRLKALVHTIRQIGDHIGTAAEILSGPLLVDLLLNQILSAWPRAQTNVADNTARAATRGKDYIEAHLAEPLTVGDVAAAACVSVRTLQSAFRAQTGRTPLGYILERRLERAHADLLTNGGRLPVSQIAYRWGFLHMGEFSRRYRQRYGCPPSQTSRRVV